jgi:hypothetical protein
MVRLLIQLLFSLLANAIGLVTASFFLDGFSITTGGVIIATLFFTLAVTVLGPLITKIAFKNDPYLKVGIALVTTLVGLIITAAITSGLNISGVSTWIAATVIVWVFSVAASVLLPLFLFKKVLAKNNTPQNS